MTCFGNSSPLRAVAAHVRVSHTPVLLMVHGHESTRQTIDRGTNPNTRPRLQAGYFKGAGPLAPYQTDLFVWE